MPELTTEQAMWACAMFEQKCPNRDWKAHDQFGDCDQCPNSSGRIPLLEGVREPCVIDDVGSCHNLIPCPCCLGLGWTPTEDGWKWLFAAGTGGWLEKMKRPEAIESVKGLMDCFFAARTKVLLPLAINSKEVLEWVKENIV